MQIRTLGLAVTATGAVAQGAGIAVDAWLHAADPTLAAREGVFSLDNAGHLLLVVGVSLVVAGVALALLGPRLYAPRERPRPALRLAQWGAPLALVSSLAGGTAAASQSTLGQGHDAHVTAAATDLAGHHAASGTATPTSHPHVSVSPSAGAAADEGHGHGAGEDVPILPVKPAERAKLAKELVRARKVALRFPTIKSAEAAGYQRVVRYVPLIGSHYMRFDLVDETFDIENPEMLLYDGNDPDSKIVGLSYYQTALLEPAGFTGPNDHWHRHVGLCISKTTFEVIGDESTEQADCESRGGFKHNVTNAWMVHAWVVPGWESPIGVFSADHPELLPLKK
jgi:hypothetical protein